MDGADENDYFMTMKTLLKTIKSEVIEHFFSLLLVSY